MGATYFIEIRFKKLVLHFIIEEEQVLYIKQM